MKIIEVSAAIIIKDNKIFITERGYGEFKDFWEFPGGKLEENESKENALIREIKEELNAEIEIDKYLGKVEYDYSSFYLKMHCFIAHLKNNQYTLLEHEAAKFISIEELDSVDFLPADKLILNKIKEYILNNK